MANMLLNRLIKHSQIKKLIIVVSILGLLLAVITILLVDAKPRKTATQEKQLNLVSLIDESFSQEHAQSALTAQQAELESLKNQISELAQVVKNMQLAHEKQLKAQALQHKKELKLLSQNKGQHNQASPIPTEFATPTETLWHPVSSANQPYINPTSNFRPTIHTVSFRPQPRKQQTSHLNPAHYVPANTSVRAVILGGADADASVNGQSKNNGVMLFKFLDDGTLPNGQRSRLRGCRVSANSYGDISSERAFATLYRLSCAHPGQPIIDKAVTGWIFFNGKVGIKGQPLMRDNKVMQWAGLSGALSGVAAAAQYAQSVQQFGAYGASSVVPSSHIAPYAAYGGATKAADTLSQYYVKRAEQYHPVIQVGAGNIVTVVFKDGFYLEPDNDKPSVAHHPTPAAQHTSDNLNFSVPPEVLNQIESNQVPPAMGGLR